MFNTFLYYCIAQNRSLDSTTVVVTILSDQGGNDTVQQLLMAEVASVLQQEFPTVTITSRTLDRFGEGLLLIVDGWMDIWIDRKLLYR